ncbi:MAG: DUF547 domain-containing protein [Aureispira sp.]
MKALLTLFMLGILLLPNALKAQAPVFFDKANRFFTTYAQHNAVKYQELYHNSQELTVLVDQIKHTSLADLSVEEQKAFYINAYNLLVIKTVVEHYPIASPNEIVDFWDGISHEVAGEKVTLEQLKQQILEKYKDPKLHFVLNDGSMASAPIANFAYQPAQLEEQLKQRVIGAVNNPQWIQYESIAEDLSLPLFFERYEDAFTPTIIDFLNTYRVEAIKKTVHITYQNENWALNSYESTSSALGKKKKRVTGAYASLAQVVTLPKGVGEIMDFNSIYSVGIGNKEVGSRSTYFNSYFTAFYGVTGKLDLGVILLFRASRERDPFNTSPFAVLGMDRTPVGSSRYADFGLAHMGFQARFAPFKNINLSFEQGFMLPIRNLPKGNTVDESIYSVTQIYYIHPISSQLQLFLAFTYWQGFRPGEKFNMQIPLLRGFLNYFATPRLSFYATSMYFLEWGVGAKYLLTPKFEIQFMYSYYIPVKGVYDLLAPGATSIMTYNMGLRYRI